MSDRKLTLLGLLAAVMVLLTVIQSYMSNGSVETDMTEMPLIQGINTKDIAGIELGLPDKGVLLKKVGDQFLVVSKDNYPASMKQINNLMISCLDIRTAEIITDNTANQEELGLTEETAKSAVKFFNGDGDLITGFLVGEKSDLRGGDYVRLISKNDEVSRMSYLSMNVPWLDMTAMSYIEKALFTVEKNTIAEVRVSGPEGGYTLVSGEGDDIILEDIPDGKKFKDNISESVFTAVTNFEFSDVQRLSNKHSELDFKNSYVCRLKDASIYTFKLAQKGDKTYVKCSSVFSDKSPVVKKRGVVESEEALKEKESKLLARDTSIKFNEDHRPWVYEIASWRAINMMRPLEDLLEDKKAEGTEGADNKGSD